MRRLVVSRIVREARGVLGLHLRSPDGAMLPAFEAGAHVDMALGNGLVRQYSLCGDPAELAVYRLGIGLAADTRGGSRYVHEQLRQGDLVDIGEPRQLFGLHAQAAGHVFIAGGIGITPILSMIHACVRRGEPWRLLYCVRDRDAAAYLPELAVHGERVALHVDSEQGGARCDLDAYLGALGEPGQHVYCCGPGPLMDAVAAACARGAIASARVHFERFAASAPATAEPGSSFTLRLARSGGCHEVPADKSVLDVLEAAGVAWPYSCREGLCRSCEAGVLSGEVDHRDYVLSDEERAANRSMMVCVSRGRGTLELDV
ncbi:oxidoreductase [Achromobacter pestifer]|uniref:Oxidoreductase n=1 Tax=Achromobacter pestifer TaxID=1353889 RepID=A0A7D4ID14_9BURK|nr:PDR/VanB family oxidoreductase [Achromobacter pestifer]QKH39082.1 oxidoreductase [Achromobacter pestifer]